jgi:hypothetical protein
MARVFAVMAQILLNITRVAPRFVRANRVTGVQGFLRVSYLSPYTGFVESSGAVTVMSPYSVILLTAGTVCKNRDKSYNLYCPC